MNILTSSFRMFRARSSDRDRRADGERVDNIMRAIDQAIASAESERAGLQRRLETATTTAAMNAGTGVDEYVDRDADQADVLRTEENHMRNATARLRQLERHIADLNAARDACAEKLADYHAQQEASPLTA